MKYSLLIVIFFLLIFNTPCFSQTMVLQVDRSRDSIPSERGPNMKKFGCLFLGGGFALSGDKEGAKIKYGSSGELYFGYRAKYKVSPIYSLGWEMMLHWQYYKLSQVSGKILPDSLLHDVERFDISSIGASFYNRFNFDPKRGDYLRNFLDVGITGEWFYDFDH